MLSFWKFNLCCQKILPGPDFHFGFMKNWFQTSLYWSRVWDSHQNILIERSVAAFIFIFLFPTIIIGDFYYWTCIIYHFPNYACLIYYLVVAKHHVQLTIGRNCFWVIMGSNPMLNFLICVGIKFVWHPRSKQCYCFQIDG